MTDIHIGHCHIRASPAPGSGLGWAGEAEQRAFAARVQRLVLAMLDELLAPHLAGREPTAVPRTLALNLALSARDLSGAAPLARLHLRDRLRGAIAEAFTRAPAAPPRPEHLPASARGAARASPDAPLPSGPVRAPSPARLLDLLVEWCRARQLGYRLAAFADDALASVLEEVLAELAAVEGTRAGGSGSADPPPAAAPAFAAARGRRRSLRAALEALVEAATAAREIGAGPAQEARLARALGGARRALHGKARDAERQDRPGATVTRASESAAASKRVQRPGEHPPAVVVAGPAPARATVPFDFPSLALPNGHYRLDSVLPFLALQPLARHGILAPAAAMDRRGEAGEALCALAFAAALRMLDPPGPDGRWSDAQRRTAALLVGRAAPLDGAALRDAAARADEICALTSGSLAGALIAGHRPGLPMPLLADGDALVVFEAEGLYPLCRLSGGRIAQAFAGGAETFYLPDPDAALLHQVDAAGLGAVAPGAPARGEGWRPAAAPGGWRGMTNLAPERFAATAMHLPQTARAARRAAEVWHALTAARPLLAQPADDGFLHFDRTAALLAGLALADIAWTMFGRDPASWMEPDPLLAVERFADLSGVLEVTSASAIVTLPLGARFADLRDAGLLDTIAAVPWWPGRAIAFRGG